MNKHKDDNLFYFTTKAPRAYTEVDFPEEVYFLFGKETKGLPEDFLKEHYDDRCVRIPMISESRSLNLSNSAAIAAYEYLRQHKYFNLQQGGKLHGEN